MIALNNFIAYLQRMQHSPFSMQMSLSHMKPQLKGLICRIANHQVTIGIKAGGPAAEGLCAIGIREHIIPMTVALHNL